MSNEAEEKHVMILAASTEWHTPESKLFEADCGHRCWISPDSQAMLAKRTDIVTSCMPCTGYTPQDLFSERTEVKEVPGQHASLSKHLGEDITNEIFKRLGIERATDQ